MLRQFDVVLWSVFFLVPTGRGAGLERLDAQEYEWAFARLWYHSQRAPYAIKTTEAPHYRRWVLQHRGRERGDATPSAPWQLFPTNDGRGTLFIGHTGEIYPSGFLPLECGRFPQDDVVWVYRHHPTFRMLRDVRRLGGKCGVCEYRQICGGSRARAYAVTGDPMAEEPDCCYQPKRAALH